MVAAGDLIVVEVMRAGDLDGAGAEIGVRIFIGDDRDQATMFLRTDRDLAELADDRLIALVGGMHRNGAVAQHRLGPGRRDRDVVALLLEHDIAVGVLLDIGIGLAAGQRILEVPHVAVGLAVLDFEIGNRRLELRIPVNEPLAAIDQAFLVERDEDFQNGLGQAFVHGEAFARPVAGCAEAAELVEDQAARFRLPLPDLVDEGLAAHGAAMQLLFHELALDDHLRRDARMVHARLPEHVLAAHALEADHDVLQRVVERVAHVQRTGDVRRRNDDTEGVGTRLGAGARSECVLVFPGLGNAWLDGRGIIVFFKHFRRPGCCLDCRR